MGFTTGAGGRVGEFRSAQNGDGWATHQYRGWSGVGRKGTGGAVCVPLSCSSQRGVRDVTSSESHQSDALSNLMHEERRFEPPAELAANANVKADAYAAADADF